jgi:hypothetical protein
MPDGTPDRHTEQPPEKGEFLALEAGDDDDAGDGDGADDDDAGDGADGDGDGDDGGGDGDDAGEVTMATRGGLLGSRRAAGTGESGRVTRSRLPRPGRGAPPGWAVARPRWPRWPGRHHRR